MTTAYTRDKLDELERTFAGRLPRLATQADLRTAPRVTAFTMAGSEGGIVFTFKMPDGKHLTTYLTVVAATELARGIAAAADDGRWESSQLYYRRDPTMPVPTGQDADAATHIVSLTTAGAGPEMLVHFAAADSAQTVLLGLPRDIAAKMLIGINAAGDRAAWWTEDGVLLSK
jgi:hypothetical protein